MARAHQRAKRRWQSSDLVAYPTFRIPADYLDDVLRWLTTGGACPLGQGS